MLTLEEKIRYARTLAIPEISGEGMERIRKAKVAVIGCGALGSLCSMYLAGAGVGTIKIVDFDTIDISNLHRQLFYESTQLGKSKAGILSERLSLLNPDCNIISIEELITDINAKEFLEDVDFVVDATDNPDSKYRTDRVCHAIGLGYCIGGVSGFQGQVMSWKKGTTRYSDIFSPEEIASGFTPCSIGGVFGPAAGVVASCQASETLKHLSGCGEMLYNRIFAIDTLDMTTNILEIG